MAARRGVVIVLVLLLIAMFVSIGGLLLLTALFGSSTPPTVPADASIYLKLSAPFDEVEPLDLLGAFSDRTPNTLRDVVNEIRRAKADSRVKNLVILPQVTGALWAQLQEVRDALLDFKQSGKPVTAYLEDAGSQEYYIASAADRVVMTPAGSLDLTGVATYELFFRGALDKIGATPDMLHIGDYKTASNTFDQKGFTPAHREMDQWLNRDFYDELVRAVAAGRKRPEAEIRQTIDNGPFSAAEAQKAGLLDAVAYEDQLADTAPVKGTRRFDGDQYARAGMSTPGIAVGGPRVALLYAVGTITSGKSAIGGGSLGSETFVQWVRKMRLDPDIKAIVVRIDSPGGSATASDIMWRELKLASDVKPLVVSMGDVAASGGYYIAAPANVIVAEPGTITGSIGVVTGKVVVKGTLDKLGIGEDSVSDGRYAELDSPFREFSKDEHEKIDAAMHATYDMFVSRVAEGRHLSPEQVDAIGRGRVWTGRQGKEKGLVDEIGGLETAIQAARTRAHIDPKTSIDLVVYPPKRGLWDLIASASGGSTDASLSLLLSRPEARLVSWARSLTTVFRAGEPLTLMPNVFWTK